MNGAGRVHRLSAEDFDGLAAGRPGPAALEALRRGQLSYRLLSLRTVAALARERVPQLWQESGAARAWESLDAVDRADRRALETVLTHPLLGVPIARWLRRLKGPADPELGADLSRLGWIAAAASLRAGLPVRLDLSVHRGLLALPTLGVARLPAGTRTVRLADGVLTAPGFAADTAGPAADPPTGAPGWLPLRRLSIHSSVRSVPPAPWMHVTLEDTDSERDIFRAPVAGRQTDSQVARWQSSLCAAWDLLRTHVPERAATCAALCTCVVPLVPSPERWTSSASREAFGAVGLAPTADPVRLAEGLVHEVAHVALGALVDLVDLCDPEDAGRHRVGWRPDPRPLGAVLQGTYAHLAALEFLGRHRGAAARPEDGHCDDGRPDDGRPDDGRSERRFRKLHTQVLDALDLLDGCPGLSPLGRRFCGVMASAAEDFVPTTPGISNGWWRSG